ncbi:MAG: peptide chain release factor N(5)-glutamine methyltransferase [Arachnia sp.]
MTARAVAHAARLLSEAGLPSPASDARLLLSYVLGVDASALVMAQAPSPAQATRLLDLVRRRSAGEPVQHLTGQAYFRHETLAVGPGVFIPRPETELLVDEVIRFVGSSPPRQHRIVELCAGSGAITLALAHELVDVDLHAVEASPAAFAYLRRNLSGTGAHLVLGRLHDELGELDGTVDVVVVNPPYIPSAQRAALPADVAGNDPDEALFGGEDGLDVIRAVAEAGQRLLRPGGLLVCEHHQEHQCEVAALLGAPGFIDAQGHRDLAGRPRYVTSRRAHGRIGP